MQSRPKEQAHLKLPEVLNLKLVPGGVEVSALHLSLHTLISGDREKACQILLTVFNQSAACTVLQHKRRLFM